MAIRPKEGWADRSKIRCNEGGMSTDEKSTNDDAADDDRVARTISGNGFEGP